MKYKITKIFLYIYNTEVGDVYNTNLHRRKLYENKG